MPYISKVITPVQYSDRHTVKKAQFYKGFSTVDSTRSDSRLYDYELLKQDLFNQFNIRKNERVMSPNFGTVIWDLLFEPFTDSVKSQIIDDITRIVSGDPRVQTISVNIVEQDYGLLLEITLLFKDSNQSENLKFSFNKTTGLTTV
jgi:phage baseplate assembly protein W